MSTSTPATVTKTTFSPSQIFKNTPQWASTVADVIIYIAAVLNAVMLMVPQIPKTVQTDVATYSVEIVGVVNFICNMFGIQTVTPPTPATK